MAYQKAMGWVVTLVVLLAASRVVVQAAHERTLSEWTSTNIKHVTDSASTTTGKVFENSEQLEETILDSSNENTDHAIDFSEPDSKTFDLLEESKEMAFDKDQAAKRGSAASAEASMKEYDTVIRKFAELPQQVKDKMPDNILDQCGESGRVCQSCHDCCGAMICCRAPDQQGSGNCNELRWCPYGEGYCP